MEASKLNDSKKTKMSNSESNYNASNLKNNINEGLYDRLSDRDLLIAILKPAHPHMDVTPIANSLILKFINFANVIKATKTELASVKGITKTAINMINLMSIIVKETIRRSTNCKTLPQIKKTSDLILWIKQIQNNNLGFHIFFLNGANNVITHQFKDMNKIEVTEFSLDIIKEALHLNACGLIVFRLTDSNDNSPNKRDISLGQALKEKGNDLEIKLKDYIIFNQTNYSTIQCML